MISGSCERCCWTSTSTGMADSMVAMRPSIWAICSVALATRRISARSSGSALVASATSVRTSVLLAMLAVSRAMPGSTRSALMMSSGLTRIGRFGIRGIAADPKGSAAEQLDVVGLGGAAERPRQAEAVERGLADTLDARRVGRPALGVRVVREAADLDRVLRAPVARQPDEVQVQRAAERIQAGGDDWLAAARLFRARRLEEAVVAAEGAERRELGGHGDRAREAGADRRGGRGL